MANATATQQYTVWQLARLADVSDPDADDSAGARFLRQVETAAAEIADEIDADTVGGDLDDRTHEEADSLVPIYTHERWQVFVDLAAYNVDVDEYSGGGHDMTELAGIALYEVARTLLAALVDEVRDGDES